MPVTRRDTEDKRWQSQHQRHMKECRQSKAQVLLIGDSIIQQMQYHPFWDEFMDPLQTANFGIGGDCMQTVLFRIESGCLELMKPKVIVVHVGTNNIYATAEEICSGIIRIIETLKEKVPSASIVIWGLLPRGEYPNKLSDKNDRINKLLEKKLTGISKVTFISTGDSLRRCDGTIDTVDMYDYLHLTDYGYRKVFSPVVTVIRRLLEIKPEDETPRLG